MARSHDYHVYILASRTGGTLYIGVTSNLAKRISEHQSGEIPGFASRYGVRHLVYFEHYRDVAEAIRREKLLKKWNRQWKIRLIEDHNPDWHDLSAAIVAH